MIAAWTRRARSSAVATKKRGSVGGGAVPAIAPNGGAIVNHVLQMPLPPPHSDPGARALQSKWYTNASPDATRYDQVSRAVIRVPFEENWPTTRDSKS